MNAIREGKSEKAIENLDHPKYVHRVGKRVKRATDEIRKRKEALRRAMLRETATQAKKTQTSGMFVDHTSSSGARASTGILGDGFFDNEASRSSSASESEMDEDEIDALYGSGADEDDDWLVSDSEVESVQRESRDAVEKAYQRKRRGGNLVVVSSSESESDDRSRSPPPRGQRARRQAEIDQRSQVANSRVIIDDSDSD